MLESIKLVYHQVIEAYTEGGMKAIFRSRVFWNRLATPVVMELSTSDIPPAGHLQSNAIQFVEIKIEDLQTGRWSFAILSRGLKAWRNLKRGFRCFAIMEDSTVVGDVWCLMPHKDGKPISHPDLKMLGIKCEKGEAYAFDAFIDPVYRGKALAVPLQKFLHASIKKDGCQKVYGFYWNDNLPALWMHRMVRYKELPKRCISKFFFLVKSEGTGLPESSNQNAKSRLA